MSNTEKLLKQILENQATLERKIDKNHKEVITRLDRLEQNQDAIKRFILESDNTFKKSEETYKVYQELKQVFSK